MNQKEILEIMNRVIINKSVPLLRLVYKKQSILTSHNKGVSFSEKQITLKELESMDYNLFKMLFDRKDFRIIDPYFSTKQKSKRRKNYERKLFDKKYGKGLRLSLKPKNSIFLEYYKSLEPSEQLWYPPAGFIRGRINTLAIRNKIKKELKI